MTRLLAAYAAVCLSNKLFVLVEEFSDMMWFARQSYDKYDKPTWIAENPTLMAGFERDEDDEMLDTLTGTIPFGPKAIMTMIFLIC